MRIPVFEVSDQVRHSHRRWLEAYKKSECTTYIAKTKVLISCAFVFAYAKAGFFMTWLNYFQTPCLSVTLVSVCSNIDSAHDDPNVFVPLTRVLRPPVAGLLRTLI